MPTFPCPATIWYNLLLAAIDVVVLVPVRATRSVVLACLALAGAAAAGALLARLAAEDIFGLFRLAAWALFLHGAVLTTILGAIFWRARRRGWAVLWATGSAAILIIAADALLVEPTWLEVSHVRITSRKLARSWRIVLIADLQTDHVGEYERGVLRRAAAEKPDLVLLAGDYLQVSGTDGETQRNLLNAALREVDFAATAPVFVVQGNVDGASWLESFKGLGYTIAAASRSFELGGLRLTCLSLTDSFDASLEVRGGDAGQFHVVLGHCPNFALGHVEADLLLAGHTHGGQVRLPLLGPLVTLSRVPRAWVAGLTTLDHDRHLLVSRGLGMERGNAPPMRFCCRPELVVIDLVPD
ncbi:MAG: metallophosphoesterase [Thermoguttaceae bacterium]|jgi:hypothetical protein